MIPFLLAAVPLTPLHSSPPQPSAAQSRQRLGTLIAAQPSGSAEAVCPAPAQATAQANANSGVTRAAGNNFNLVDITGLFPTSLASRPTGQALSLPLTTSRFTNSNNNGDSNNTPPPCSSRTSLLAEVNAITTSNTAASPGQAGLGFGLAGSSTAEALLIPAAAVTPNSATCSARTGTIPSPLTTKDPASIAASKAGSPLTPHPAASVR